MSPIRMVDDLQTGAVAASRSGGESCRSGAAHTGPFFKRIDDRRGYEAAGGIPEELDDRPRRIVGTILEHDAGEAVQPAAGKLDVDPQREDGQKTADEIDQLGIQLMTGELFDLGGGSFRGQRGTIRTVGQ